MPRLRCSWMFCHWGFLAQNEVLDKAATFNFHSRQWQYVPNDTACNTKSVLDHHSSSQFNVWVTSLISGRGRDLSLSHHIHNSCGAHPISCVMYSLISFHEGKSGAAWYWTLTAI
jgi:hypothetical protein